MRLPELNEKVVKVRPPHEGCSKGLPGVGTTTEGGQGVRHINGDLLKISMFGCDGSECRGDPFDYLRSGSENQITEFRGPREVEGVRLAWK